MNPFRVSLIVLIGLASVLRADVPDPDPEIERKSFHIASGFEIHLFASDPMIQKPIEMNWDSRGRLWCATSETYPQLKPGQTPDDKIFILEDTTGSGRADRSTVFADHLFIPNAVAPGDGGAYVTNSTEILFLRDTKGTGHADVRRVVLAGFGTEDTHHIVHTLRWGPDGKLYFCQSIYIHSFLETPRGMKSLLGSGVWRFDPRTLELSVFSRGLVNPWGLVWDRWGQTFQTDGAGFQGINYSFPGAAFESAVGSDRVLPGMTPRSPKYCSEEILSGRNIPDSYQGDILTNDFRANRIVRFKLSDDGAGFSARQMRDFLTSSDVAFRPVDIRMGPDGAIYIADWYNPIIQHGEVDFRDPRRDHVHGRIWRVTATGRPLAPKPAIDGAPVEGLLDLLKSPEDWTRRQARLEMRERGAEKVMPALRAWVSRVTGDDAQADHDLLEALWTCQNVDAVDPDLLERVLRAHEPRARAAAVRVAADWIGKIQDPVSRIAPLVLDPFPRVRLEAVRALARIESPDSVVLATRALAQPMDPTLDFALWRTCNDLAPLWVPAFQAGKLTGWSAAQRDYALRAIKSPAALAVLVGQLKAGRTAPAETADTIDLMADIGGPEEARTLFELALRPDAADRAAMLDALRRLAARHVARPKNAADLSRLLDDSNPAARADAMRLAGFWKLHDLEPRLAAVASQPDSAAALRDAAIEGLARLNDRKSTAELRRLANAPTPAAVRARAIGGLATVDLKAAVAAAADMLRTGSGDPATILEGLLRREGAGAALASALKSAKLSQDTARLALRYLRGITTQDPKLMELLSAAAGSSSGPTRLTAEQMKTMIEQVEKTGDPADGERVFRRLDTNCYQCHSIAGSGGWLAPDLTSIGAASPIDYLINSVLDPNKDIKDGYDGWAVITQSGDVYSGIKVFQDSSHLILRDNAHERLSIPLADVKRQKSIGSLMPTGLADSLTHQEFVDLIRFLSELGRPGPYGPSTAQYIRTWRIPTSPDAANPGPPAYSLVSGDLPIDAIPTGCAVGRIDVTTPGRILLALNDPLGLKLFLDGRAIPAAPEIPLDLPTGVHALAVQIDRAARGDRPIRVELREVPGSPARARPVGGR